MTSPEAASVTARPVRVGRLHLLVHELIGSHHTGPSVADRRTSALPLQGELLTVEALLRALDRDHATVDKTGQPVDCRCNEHNRARADRDRLTAALDRVWAEPGRDRHPALLDQLLDADSRTLTRTGSRTAGSHRKPGSRPPAGLDSTDLLRRVVTGAHQHDLNLRLALHDPYELRAWRESLWAAPALTSRLPQHETHPLTVALHRDLSAWRNTCLVQLGIVAPMVTLSQRCPHCTQQTLHVREDATSDVVCGNDECIDPATGSVSRWPKAAWDDLLRGRYAHGVVNTDAAALHLGVAASTIRDWRRRGLVDEARDPAGRALGSPRQPLWRLADLVAAANAPKGRRTA